MESALINIHIYMSDFDLIWVVKEMTVKTCGVGSLTLGYAHIGLSARPLRLP